MKLTSVIRWGLAPGLFVGLTGLLWAHGDKAWPVPKEAAARKNPVSAGHESLAQGKSLYEKNCASCHGLEGKADGPMPSFKKLLTAEERWHLVNYLRTLAHPQHAESHGHGAAKHDEHGDQHKE